MKGRRDRRFRHPDEARALEYLENMGCELLRHNYQTRTGEIDLIVFQPATTSLRFVEIKSWKTGSAFHPLQRMNETRKRRSYAIADYFLFELENVIQHNLNKDNEYSFAEKEGLTGTLMRTYMEERLNTVFDLIWIQNDSEIHWFKEVF